MERLERDDVIYNFNVKLLAGGIDCVDCSWTRDIKGKDPFFKIYLPLEGEAELIINGNSKRVLPGNIYFISGWHLDRQICRKSLTTAWLHFVPDSILLQHALLVCADFEIIPKRDYLQIKETLQNVREVFRPYDESRRQTPQFLENVPDYLVCRLKAGILTVISDLLAEKDYVKAVEQKGVKLRLQKALEYMDANFLSNPSLNDISSKAYMAPNYFHKIFKETFGLTPFEYMLDKRMNIAKELLGFSSLNIKQIAEQAGYNDEFYFSKVFKKHSGVSPSKFRTLKI